jgi:hypothetical protein
MKYFLLIFFIFNFSAVADFESDLTEIASFRTEEFDNSKNYTDLSKTSGIMTEDFVSRVMNDDKVLRFFFVCYLHHHFEKRYKADKIFTQTINLKFEKKDLTEEQEKSFRRSLASLVFTDKIEHLKNALPENDRESDEYFLRTLARLEGVRLR